MANIHTAKLNNSQGRNYMVNVNLPGSRAQFMEDNVWCLKDLSEAKGG